MPRRKRVFVPGLFYHVYCRGNEKKEIFRNDEDRLRFINILKSCSGKFEYDLLSYALMPNHYHLLLNVSGSQLWKIMQYINSAYASYFNWKHKRAGHLFEGRYEYQIVEAKGYLPAVSRYIHLNPYKAGICDNLGEYPWTSFPQYCGKKGFGIAKPDWIYEKFGPGKKDAVRRYRLYIAETTGKDAVENNVVGGLVLGGSRFALMLGQACGDISRVSKYRRPCALINPDSVIAACAREFKVSQDEVIKKKGKNNFAKSSAIFLIWQNSGMSHGEIGKIFNGLDVSSVKRTVARVKREIQSNPELAERLKQMEDNL